MLLPSLQRQEQHLRYCTHEAWWILMIPCETSTKYTNTNERYCRPSMYIGRKHRGVPIFVQGKAPEEISYPRVFTFLSFRGRCTSTVHTRTMSRSCRVQVVRKRSVWLSNRARCSSHRWRCFLYSLTSFIVSTSVRLCMPCLCVQRWIDTFTTVTPYKYKVGITLSPRYWVDDEGGFDMTERLHVFLENCQPGQVKSSLKETWWQLLFCLGFRV
jgi:hypothetical protein